MQIYRIQILQHLLFLRFNAREGLILHNVGYNDDSSGKFRPILYRGSLAEVATYYADPRPPFHRKYVGNIYLKYIIPLNLNFPHFHSRPMMKAISALVLQRHLS